MVYPVKPNLLTPALPAKTVPIVWMLILASTRMRSPHSRGVADFVARAVKIVVISGIDVTDANRESWNQTLTNAREAGIPVALIDPKHAPEDELLYAVILHLNTNSADSGDTADTKPMTITDAVLTITRDEPPRTRAPHPSSKSPFPNQALEAEKAP